MFQILSHLSASVPGSVWECVPPLCFGVYTPEFVKGSGKEATRSGRGLADEDEGILHRLGVVIAPHAGFDKTSLRIQP